MAALEGIFGIGIIHAWWIVLNYKLRCFATARDDARPRTLFRLGSAKSGNAVAKAWKRKWLIPDALLATRGESLRLYMGSWWV
ncbi:hypothetical protein QFZ96_002007 [Paraburkholderia youngii]